MPTVCEQAATITDEDIDAIIQKGKLSTEELNKKMRDYTDNAMKFTMDGGIAYDYKDEDDELDDNVDYKSLAGKQYKGNVCRAERSYLLQVLGLSLVKSPSAAPCAESVLWPNREDCHCCTYLEGPAASKGMYSFHKGMQCDRMVCPLTVVQTLVLIAGSNWVDPPKRERKRHVNYAENEYFRNALKSGPGRPSGPRAPKMPVLQDFQFFNSSRITELIEKQHEYDVYLHSLKKEKADKVHAHSYPRVCSL